MEFKYELGQRLYFLENNIVKCDTVVSRAVVEEDKSHYFRSRPFTYRAGVFYSLKNGSVLEQNKVFATKEDLAADLIK